MISMIFVGFRFQETIVKNRAYKRTPFRIIMLFAPILVLVAFHLVTCLIFMRSYGYLSMLINPARSWSLIFALCLWWQAKGLEKLDFT